MNGLDTVRALVQKGYSPVQAAALAGHMAQESGFDSTNVNQKEGAHGLLQWEGPRWDALQSFAKAQGKSPTDPSVQMDFIGSEMAGPEAKSSKAFLSATDVPTASAALKNYVRFGDDSAGKRTGNAMDLYSQYTGGAGAPVGALMQGDPTNPIDPTQTTAGATAAPLSLAPDAVGALAPPTMAQGLAKLGATLNPAQGGQPAQQAPQQSQFLAPQQIQMPQINPQSQQIAALIAKQYGLNA